MQLFVDSRDGFKPEICGFGPVRASKRGLRTRGLGLRPNPSLVDRRHSGESVVRAAPHKRRESAAAGCGLILK